MSTYLNIRNGGKTNEEGAMRLFAKLAGTQNKGKVGVTDLAVSQNGTPNMSVNVAAGDIIIPYQNYIYHGWSDAVVNKTVSAADPSNPRIDRVVAYVDLSVVSSASSNNPGALLFAVVAGTPASSPTRPSDPTVQAAVGAGNPFVDLADLAVSAADTSIITSEITDKRALFSLSGGVGGIEFGIPGALTVNNDLTPYWIAPRDGLFTSIYARVKTAPTGQALNMRLNKNGSSAATFSIAAGATNVSSTGLSIAFVAGDYFNFDVTQVGSTLPGSDLTVAVG